MIWYLNLILLLHLECLGLSRLLFSWWVTMKEVQGRACLIALDSLVMLVFAFLVDQDFCFVTAPFSEELHFLRETIFAYLVFSHELTLPSLAQALLRFLASTRYGCHHQTPATADPSSSYAWTQAYPLLQLLISPSQ